MYRNGRATSVWMAQDMMAAADAYYVEASLFECADNARARKYGQWRH
jgi:endonuclease YncB( thermonuclease family)